jgi:hypothetical protein
MKKILHVTLSTNNSDRVTSIQDIVKNNAHEDRGLRIKWAKTVKLKWLSMA